MANKRLAILIPSCDNYSDMWTLLSQCYEIFWSDCPYFKYIITNSEKEVPQWFQRLNVWIDTDWSSNVIKSLSMIKEEYILMHIDDLIFTQKIEQEKIWQLVAQWIENDINYLKLLHVIKSSQSETFIPYDTYAPYRSSTVFSVWKKEVLLHILQPWESPRQFEVDGTERTRNYNKRYCSKENIFQFENLIIKRKIEPNSLQKLKKKWFHYDGDRSMMSLKESSIYKIKCWIFEIILYLPTWLSNFLVGVARKI